MSQLKEKLKDFGEYVSEGIEEEGRSRDMVVKSTTILSINKGKMPESIFVLQQFARAVAQRNYTANIYRVLMYFFGLSEYENFLCVDVKTISEKLLMTERSVMRATKTLEKDNILKKIKHPNDKRRVDYFLNPMAAWRGKAINRTKTIKKLEDGKHQLEMF